MNSAAATALAGALGEINLVLRNMTKGFTCINRTGAPVSLHLKVNQVKLPTLILNLRPCPRFSSDNVHV